MISVITPALVKDEYSYQWLHECIASVKAQPGQWEHIVVNDHSPVKLDALKAHWPHVRWLDAEGTGVSSARNQAAEAARYDLLLPLDADDKLGPDALATFLDAWNKRGDARIIYSDVIMFGEDYARVYLAAEYDFSILMHATFMTVGCLHSKEDWERVGGWRLDMTHGLEDWEYWIAMGEVGVCGKRVPEPLYWYRRHPRGRLQWLRSASGLWDRAYLAMRELHKDSFNGRYPMGCCGGRSRAAATKPVAAAMPARVLQAASASAIRTEGIMLVYNGARKGDFLITGGVTRTKYHVPGQGGIVELAGTRTQGIKPADLPWFLSVNQGRDFKVVEQPKVTPVPLAPPIPQAVKEEAWEPSIVEFHEPAPEPIQGPDTGLGALDVEIEKLMAEVPDIQALTVAEIRGMDLEPDMAQALRGQELAGKNRKTVLEFLEGLI